MLLQTVGPIADMAYRQDEPPSSRIQWIAVGHLADRSTRRPHRCGPGGGPWTASDPVETGPKSNERHNGLILLPCVRTSAIAFPHMRLACRRGR
ncbi:Hypothetical protein I596_1451 [Dokdonella koreensis DS-123]|uniref:Uncharacterized protein n=1 Tax=Dokdonella koreensis DS-123 TaxID=1300342 RepID=A0A160DT10_9GAMM|nr:Hypothetical protein I596_1451 [Dokdonella koreensis DS-123]